MSAKCYLKNPKVLVEVQDDGTVKIKNIGGFPINGGGSGESSVIPFIIKVRDSQGNYDLPIIAPWQESERPRESSIGPYVPIVFKNNTIVVQFNTSVENYNIEIYELDNVQQAWKKTEETDYIVKDNVITLKPTIISDLITAKEIILTKRSENNEESESYIYAFNNAQAQ